MFCYDDEKSCFKCIVFHVLQNAILHKESDYSLWFSVGSMCSFEFFFPNSMYFGPQGWCLEVGEHCALSLLQIVKFGCFEEVASYIHLFVGKLQKFWSIPIMYVLLDVWDMVLHVLHFISFSSSPLKNSQKNQRKKSWPRCCCSGHWQHQGYTHAHKLARQSSSASD